MTNNSLHYVIFLLIVLIVKGRTINNFMLLLFNFFMKTTMLCQFLFANVVLKAVEEVIEIRRNFL